MSSSNASNVASPSLAGFTEAEGALVDLGIALTKSGYRFTTITPAGHAAVNARVGNEIANDLAGVFGWNRPFKAGVLPAGLIELMHKAQIVDERGNLPRSSVRFSTIGDRIILHSGYPTIERDSVFFGPDTYRFVHLLNRVLIGGGHLLELGAGSGAAALCVASRFKRLHMTDINPLAQRFARINAAIAGIVHAETAIGDLFSAATGSYDAIIANPPFMIDPSGRWYRDGGGSLGIELAVRIVTEAVDHLRPHGILVVYTGSPIVDGCDRFHLACSTILDRLGIPFAYEELDVDVFSDELSQPAYTGIDRIAVVALSIGAP